MTSLARAALDGLLDIVYPPKCVVCGDIGTLPVCPACRAQVASVPEPYCSICGHTITGHICWHCSERVRSFTAARAVGEYSGVLREAIHQFKYGGARMLAEPLASFIHEYLTTAADIPWQRAGLIIPVPMHTARRRIRGYNQSELLAERLGPLVELPVISDAVMRVHYKGPQVELSGRERRDNVKNAFQVVNPSAVRKKTVLLIDDVATTCSTVHECSLSLLKAGAARVYVVCVAFDI